MISSGTSDADDHRPSTPAPEAARAETAAPASPPPAPGTGVPGDVHLVPVDPHRVFAHWHIAPETLRNARDEAGAAGQNAGLTLRLYRLGEDETGAREPQPVEEFPAAAGWHEGFFSLREPGGTITAGIGVKQADESFRVLMMSRAVTLPEAMPGAFAPPPPIPPASAKPAPAPPPPSPAKPQVLDEAAILARTPRLAELPAELKKLPDDEAAAAVLAAEYEPLRGKPFPLSLPETPVLNERDVVATALEAAGIAATLPGSPAHPAQVSAPTDANVVAEAAAPEAGPAGEPSPAVRAQATPPPAPANDASSHRFASNFDPTGEQAPIRLEATLVITGRVQPGHRLRLGDREIALQPGGTFSVQQRLMSFDGAWALLLYAASRLAASEGPSLELLSAIPDAAAAATLHAYVSIEGELRDPGYLARLPGGITVDAAGRFRVVHALPFGALMLPHLVLVADPA